MKKPAGEGGLLRETSNSHPSNDTAVSGHRVMVMMVHVVGVNHETTV
jgi:hypothetical protein